MTSKDDKLKLVIEDVIKVGKQNGSRCLICGARIKHMITTCNLCKRLLKNPDFENLLMTRKERVLNYHIKKARERLINEGKW